MAEALRHGWRTTVVCGGGDCLRQIHELGAETLLLAGAASRISFVNELRRILRIRRLLIQHPDAVLHLVGLKAIVEGWLARFLMRGTHPVLNAVSGLGLLFTGKPHPARNALLMHSLRILMNGQKHRFIFQNEDDLRIFRKFGLAIHPEPSMTFGSGVNLSLYPASRGQNATSPSIDGKHYRPINPGFNHQCNGETAPLTVLFCARLLKSKGLGILHEAAGLLRDKWEHRVVFKIYGIPSDNPDAFSRAEMEDMAIPGYFELMGDVPHDGMPEVYMKADIMALPGHYREGIPKALLEASAAGLPIVTTDHPGYRETVEPGTNGILIPTKNPDALAEALETLLANADLRLEMGRASRARAERLYSDRPIAQLHLSLYESLLTR